jgi:hypothetical protein
MNSFSRRSASLLAMLFALSFSLSAQQGLGWLTDPHAGISGAFLQPAATSATPYNWDFTLGAVGFGLRNNFVFLENTAGIPFLRQAASAQESIFSETEFSFTLDDQRYAYDFPTGDRPIYASLSAEVTGPSFSVQIGEFTRVGVFTRIRSMASTRGLDADLNFYPYDAAPFGADIPVNEAYAAAAAWGEVGLNLSRAFAVGYDGELRIGISPKYLIGIEGASANSRSVGAIRKLDGDSTIVNNLNGEIAFTNAFRQAEAGNTTTGTGFVVDLGVQYAWGETSEAGHRYTLGLSLLDVGGISFNQGAQVHRFTNTGDILLDADDYEFEDNFTDQAIRQLSQDVFDGAESSLVRNEFMIDLPATLSAQFSFRPAEEVQLSAVYRGDIRLHQEQLSRGSQFVAAAHFSKWWYGAGLTAGVQDWDKFNLGFQLRLGPLYFGTDELIGTVLQRAQLSGGSFYAGLRLHDFGGSKRGRSRKGKGVKCYEF